MVKNAKNAGFSKFFRFFYRTPWPQKSLADTIGGAVRAAAPVTEIQGNWGRRLALQDFNFKVILAILFLLEHVLYLSTRRAIFVHFPAFSSASSVN